MQDEKIAFDEARRIQRHNLARNEVENRVSAEIRASTRASGVGDADAPRIDALADRMRSKAIDDVAQTEDEIARQRRYARIRQFVDYGFGLVYGLLALRFLLLLADARQGAGFVRMINTLTAPLFAPFRNALPTPATEQGYAFSPSLLLAILAYVLLHLSIKGLLRVIGRRSTEL